MTQTAEIVLHIQNPADLFKSPKTLFDNRQLLDRDIEAYLMEKAGSCHRDADVCIVITIKVGAAGDEKEDIIAIHRHFSYSYERAKKQLNHTLNLGWRSLVIAFVFVLLMYFIANKLIPQFSQGGFTTPIRELFIILGWVALWRPAELLLYDWFPIRKNARLFKRLSQTKIVIRNG